MTVNELVRQTLINSDKRGIHEVLKGLKKNDTSVSGFKQCTI
jgi:hypothetical protein